jgi:phage-related protein
MSMSVPSTTAYVPDRAAISSVKSPYEANVDRYGAVAANAMGLAQAATDQASTTVNLSNQALDKFSASVQDTAASTTGMVDAVEDAIEGGIQAVGDGLQQAADAMANGWHSAENAVVDGWHSAESTVTEGYEAVTQGVINAADAVGQAATAAYDAVASATDQAVSFAFMSSQV